jgi:hypothetical protein
MLGLILVFAACFVAWPKLEVQPKSISRKFVPMRTQTVHHERVSEEKKEGISPEVQRRLAAAGLKTDSFITVKTEKNK